MILAQSAPVVQAADLISRMPPLGDIIGTVFEHGRSLLIEHGTVVKRSPASFPTSGPTASSTCSNNNNSDTCEKPTVTPVIPIVLGTVIPLTAAFVALLILHRRNKKRVAMEDSRDAEKYRSLDFGMDLNFRDGRKKGRNGGTPDMSQSRSESRQMKGLSIDAGPFLFPESAKDSAASIHSLSRGANDPEGAYRLADDMVSVRSMRMGRGDTDSMYDGASSMRRHDAMGANSSQTNLLRNPQPFGQSPAHHSLSAPALDASRDSYFDKGARDLRKSNNYLKDYIQSRDISMEDRALHSHPAKMNSADSTLVDSSPAQSPKEAKPVHESSFNFEISAPEIDVSPPVEDRRSVQKQLPPQPLINVSSPVHENFPRQPQYPAQSQMQHEQYQQDEQNLHHEQDMYYDQEPRQHYQEEQYQHYDHAAPQHSLLVAQHHHRNASDMSESSNYGEEHHFAGAVPTQQSEQQHPFQSAQHLAVVDHKSMNRLSVSMRPLPAEEPNESPEVRANRIRSFYKEYFDHNEGQPPIPTPPAEYRLQPGDYYEDYSQEYMNAATVYDATNAGFVVGAPYAEPITRRAMTPPPRAPPRFRGHAASGSNPGSRSNSRPGSSVSRGPNPQYRSRANSSGSRYDMGQRAESSMSNAPRGRTQQRKNVPPPTALTSLPTPHMLQNDAVFNAAIDFAPPASYRDRQAGRRADSPLGTPRPYSPSVRSFNPLASSFDDLTSIPSPHALRKSGIFTSLDFAPPKKFKDEDGMSDAGSIRSGRSGRSTRSAVSTQHMYNIRNGAYRVSRLPKELTGTRDELAQSLRPTWDLRGPA